MCQEEFGQDCRVLGGVSMADETKLELFGHMDQWYIWREKGQAYDQKNPICTVKQGGG